MTITMICFKVADRVQMTGTDHQIKQDAKPEMGFDTIDPVTVIILNFLYTSNSFRKIL